MKDMRIGTQVVMTDCLEAEEHKDRVWTTASDVWMLGDGTRVVLLEGFKGGFSVDKLKVVSHENSIC